VRWLSCLYAKAYRGCGGKDPSPYYKQEGNRVRFEVFTAVVLKSITLQEGNHFHDPIAYPRFPFCRYLGGLESWSGHGGEDKHPYICQESNPGRPVRSQLLYYLKYPTSYFHDNAIQTHI
jgi:hypothetical protein